MFTPSCFVCVSACVCVCVCLRVCVRVCVAEQMFWEVMQLRREMSFAKLGYYKDQLWLTDRRALQSPQTLAWSSAPSSPHPPGSGFSSPLLLPPLCVSVFLCVIVFSHRKRSLEAVGGLLSLLSWTFCWFSVQSLNLKYENFFFFETRNTPISGDKRHKKRLYKLWHVGIEPVWGALTFCFLFLPVFTKKESRGWNKSFSFLTHHFLEGRSHSDKNKSEV